MSWWDDFATASSSAQTSASSATGPANAWLGTQAGGIAGGIEGGIVALFHDLWDAIIGPVEVFLGASIIVLAIILLFRNEALAAARIAMA